jgi:predicted DNA-binding transcriptional regulator AlpA
VNDLAQLLGEANLQRLADVAGGTRLSVPLHAGKPPNGGRDGYARLSRLVGADLAVLLIFHFGDSTLYVPRLESGHAVDPKEVARLTRRGLKARDIARVLCCSERTVYKHRARTRTGSIPKPRKTKERSRST